MFVYVGCYTTPDRDGRGKGIVGYRMDPASGEWSPLGLVAEVPNPSFLALNSSGSHLYCVHGGDDFSMVSAFVIDKADGSLRPLGSQPTLGHNPVALTLSAGDRYLAVAGYGNGTVTVLPVNADGSIAPHSDHLAMVGYPGPHPTEQRSSHPHHIPYDPAGKYFIVPDKGFDRVYIFTVDEATGKMVPGDPPSLISAAGSAPRHAAFHPSERFCWVINEIDSTLSTYEYRAATGTLRHVETISTLPPRFSGRNSTAEIQVAPSGRFVYGSNRGHDSIAVFAVDGSSGKLSPVGWQSSGGSKPRFFALDPSGTFLYAANQDSDNIVTFRVNAETGLLDPTGQVIHTGSPVTIVFAPAG
jgi:6-phosphogluconolactonase (cycloisomerase 2 family)